MALPQTKEELERMCKKIAAEGKTFTTEDGKRVRLVRTPGTPDSYQLVPVDN